MPAQPFIDDDFLLTGMHWKKLRALVRCIQFYAVTYNDAHEQMEEDGWTFTDWCQADLGSDANLEELGAFQLDESGNPCGWPEMNTGRWFPEPTVYWLAEVPNIYWHTIGAGGFIIDDWNHHGQFVGSLAFILNPTARWYLAIMQRCTTRLAQHRIAKCIENAFGIDNRGRPSEQ